MLDLAAGGRAMDQVEAQPRTDIQFIEALKVRGAIDDLRTFGINNMKGTAKTRRRRPINVTEM